MDNESHWSKVPERDILEVGTLLSPRGVYLVNELDTLELQGANTAREEQDRMESIKLAHKVLQ